MNINRHNYEEYFILYMDNELSSDDRRMVEDFVQLHPDLKEELDLLLQYKLEPDTSVVFKGKEELVKINGTTPVTLTNYEEWLVLYLDNELTPARREEVEAFIHNNPAIKEEFALLQKTKLQPDTIVFANKESLYREEEKVRVIPFPWRRIAAAVLIIALGITSLIVLKRKPVAIEKGGVVKTTPGNPKQNNSANNTVQQSNEVNPVITDKKPDETVNQIAVTNKQPTHQVSSPAVVQKENKYLTLKENKLPAKNIVIPAVVPVQNKNEQPVLAQAAGNKPGNNLPEPVHNPNVTGNNKGMKDVIAYESNPKNNVKEDPEVTIPPLHTSEPNNPAIKTAARTQGSETLEEGSDNKKSRGLFRKIARTFEKRTNMSATDDDRLLVAGLSFKLK